jgi:hypothetical protein
MFGSFAVTAASKVEDKSLLLSDGQQTRHLLLWTFRAGRVKGAFARLWELVDVHEINMPRSDFEASQGSPPFKLPVDQQVDMFSRSTCYTNRGCLLQALCQDFVPATHLLRGLAEKNSQTGSRDRRPPRDTAPYVVKD